MELGSLCDAYLTPTTGLVFKAKFPLSIQDGNPLLRFTDFHPKRASMEHPISTLTFTFYYTLLSQHPRIGRDRYDPVTYVCQNRFGLIYSNSKFKIDSMSFTLVFFLFPFAQSCELT